MDVSTTPEERMGYRNLERIHVYICILGREIRESGNKNGHTWLCATLCMQLVGWGRGRVGVICGSNVGKRLQNDIGHANLKNCSWMSSYDSNKMGITWICKKGMCLSHIKSGKYGLKVMRHKIAHMYVVRKNINIWPWYRLLLSPNNDWFSWIICNGCGMPAGNAYPSGHLVPSRIFGLANAPIVETKFLELAMSLLDFSPLGTFSILLATARACTGHRLV